MGFNQIILHINELVWGWPLLIFILGVSILTTLALGGIQITQFIASWKCTLFAKTSKLEGDLTPMQAFLNVLSTGIGNGSLAGIATAIHVGGPGAALWIFIFGILSMALRFAEVFLSLDFKPIKQEHSTIGGPMIYLARLPFGRLIASCFTLFLLFFGLSNGNAMQANSISIGLTHILAIKPLYIALTLLVLILYIMAGGAQRIARVSDMLVPIKVGLFFSTAFIILGYHWHGIGTALLLIINEAFCLKAVAGGAIGYSMQQALRYGVARTINATEVGLGTAGVLFAGTAAKDPYENSLMSMVSAFISANLICFVIALLILVTGVWDQGQTSLRLTIAAYETVFGQVGGWIVTLLSITFGMGVLVAYGYITRSCWLYLTNGRFERLFECIFCGVTFFGALAGIDIIWNLADLANAGLLITNLLGIVYYLPYLNKRIKSFVSI